MARGGVAWGEAPLALSRGKMGVLFCLERHPGRMPLGPELKLKRTACGAPNFSCFKVIIGAEARMALRPRIQDGLGGADPSLKEGTRAREHEALSPEQEYRVRVMGEEELELLRAAASQDGLELASLNWILASLMNHGFVAISFSNDRRLRAAATEAGYLALKMRPLLPEAGSSIH